MQKLLFRVFLGLVFIHQVKKNLPSFLVPTPKSKKRSKSTLLQMEKHVPRNQSREKIQRTHSGKRLSFSQRTLTYISETYSTVVSALSNSNDTLEAETSTSTPESLISRAIGSSPIARDNFFIGIF